MALLVESDMESLEEADMALLEELAMESSEAWAMELLGMSGVVSLANHHLIVQMSQNMCSYLIIDI